MKNVSNVEIAEIMLAHGNIANSDHQQDIGVCSNLFGQLLEISPTGFTFLKTSSSEFLYIDVWFNDQNLKLLVIEVKINIALVINWCPIYKMRCSTEPSQKSLTR